MMNLDRYIVVKKAKKVALSDIKVPRIFKMSPPNPKKMIKKLVAYIRNGKFESPIIVNENMKLYDGYTSYLIAEKLDVKKVKVMIIRPCEQPKKKEVIVND